jgi:hypothetical protein
MDQVTIRAEIAAHGVPKGATVTVAETPVIAGAISNGVFTELDRISPKEPESEAGPEEAEGNELEANLIAPGDDPADEAPTAAKSPRQRKS